MTTAHDPKTQGGVPPLMGSTGSPLMGETLKEKLKQIPGWGLDDTSRRLVRTWTFGNFSEAIAFINKVAPIAESENHHPDIHLHGWNKVTLTLQTHAIGGLSENDFIVAAKVESLGLQAEASQMP